MQDRSSLIDASLERAAEALGDITEPVISRFYQAYPQAQEAFDHHAPRNRRRLEADMVDRALYWAMTWPSSQEEICIYLASSVPHRSAADYRLTVGGLVERPATYTLAQLQAMRPTRLVRDVQCVTGWRVPQTAFTGVLLSELLDAAGVRPEGKAVSFTCFDGVYSESLTLEQARRPDMLVAYRMDDKPVTDAHGGPVRLYAAPMYFYKSAKWLSGITVTDHVVPGYWEHYGYDVDAWVGRSNGRDDAPTS